MREQQLCYQRRQIEEKHWLEEIEMETIKQKIGEQSTMYTEDAPAVKIVTEEEYIWNRKSDDETFYGLETADETPETQNVGEYRIGRGSRIRYDERRREVKERNLTEEQ